MLQNPSHSPHPLQGTMTKLAYKEITHKLIGAYYNVYNGTGRTYPEYVYELALCREIWQMGLLYERQKEHEVWYKDWLVGLQRLDILAADEIILELKVAPELTLHNHAQLYSYLRAFGKQVGLLCNFGGEKPEFERLFYHRRQAVDQGIAHMRQSVADTLSPDLIAPDLVYEIIGGLYDVHTTLGPGFIKRIYANACYKEMLARGLPVTAEKAFQVIYRHEPVAEIKFSHIRIEKTVLVFPVAISNLNKIRFNNIKEWLRVTGIPLAIIANFNDLALDPMILRA